MSKVDAQRAIREARYEAYRKARAAEPAQQVAPPAAPRPADPPPTAAPAPMESAVLDAMEAEDAAAVENALCGHKGGSGKPCTRPAGHPEKSHRYK